MAAKGPYFLIRKAPFLLLGPDKWLTRQELLRNKYAVYCFPEPKDAQSTQSQLPKGVRTGTMLAAASSLLTENWIEFVPGKGFLEREPSGLGPAHEEPLDRELLLKFVAKGTGFTPTDDEPEPVAAGPLPAVQPEPKPAPLAFAAASAMDATGEGRDTTIHNGCVNMFEELLTLLEKGVVFRDSAPETLNARLSVADREIQDEMHFLEFNQLNAAEGFKVYQRLHELRLKRRDIKDSALIATFLDDLLCGVTQAKLSEYWARLKGLRSRQYLLREPESFTHDAENGRLR